MLHKWCIIKINLFITKYQLRETKAREGGKGKGRSVKRLGETRSSAIAEGLREALVSRNPATIKHLT